MINNQYFIFTPTLSSKSQRKARMALYPSWPLMIMLLYSRHIRFKHILLIAHMIPNTDYILCIPQAEAQIEEWETMRRQSTTVEDKDLNIEGVVRLTLSVEMQRFLGCVCGEHISAEMPWINIKKEQVQAYFTAENEKSEIFAVKEPLMVS